MNGANPASKGMQLVTTGPQPSGTFQLVFTPALSAVVLYGISLSFQGVSVGYKFKVTDNSVQHNLPVNAGFDPGAVNSTNGTEPEFHTFHWTETLSLIQHTVVLNIFNKYGAPTNGEIEFFAFYS